MPRLSIIVPHLHDDSALELTLLSILENREIDFEILIAHDGQYRDPYALDHDEAILIESASGASFTEQINLAVASACSPAIQVLLPGCVVEQQWCEEALDLLTHSDVAAVCQPVVDASSKEVYLGLAGDSLPHRRVTSSSHNVAGPLLCGGVFRKGTLKNIAGWLEPCQREIAEVDFALMMSAMALRIEVAQEVTVQAPKRVVTGQEAGYEIGRACGQLACAYASIEESGVVIDSLAKRLGHLAGGLMNPKTVAERLGWVMGIRDRTFVQSVKNRLELASSSLEDENTTIPLNRYSPHVAQRRAA